MSASAELARKAAEIIQTRGQCKGSYSDADGRVCLWGALMEAHGLSTAFGSMQCASDLPERLAGPIYDELMLMFPESARGNFIHPGADWNDRADTDERDVAKVLFQVADRLDVAP